MNMRGYLTRTGVGMLLGALSLGVGTAGFVRSQTSPNPTPRAPWRAPSGNRRVGPFEVKVERYVQLQGESGRPTVLVQLHLWRATGPVPLSERVRVDGVGALGGRWLLSSAKWLIRNELMQVPEGRSLTVPGLGDVPATGNAGEARAIFKFVYLGSDLLPRTPDTFTFELPSGDTAIFSGLSAESN